MPTICPICDKELSVGYTDGQSLNILMQHLSVHREIDNVSSCEACGLKFTGRGAYPENQLNNHKQSWRHRARQAEFEKEQLAKKQRDEREFLLKRVEALGGKFIDTMKMPPTQALDLGGFICSRCNNYQRAGDRVITSSGTYSVDCFLELQELKPEIYQRQ